MNSIFDMEHGSVVDSSLAAQVVQRFIAATNIDIMGGRCNILVPNEISYLSVLDRIKGIVSDARIVTPTLNINYAFINGSIGDVPVLIFCNTSGRHGYRSDDDESEDDGVIKIGVDIYSLPTVMRDLQNKINSLLEREKLAKIRWWFQGSDGRQQSHDIYLKKPTTKLHAEFYPDMGDPYKFMDEYLASDASVLLMAGPPGTGKTTFLRHLISERNLLAHVIYDENLMTKDALFQNFLFDKESNIMIIEDADTILMAREDDGSNKMMARFLSVSDGLIKLPNKKLVFTTNLSDFSRVDQALMRPGRCHAVVHMRPLNLNEAQAAAKIADLPCPTQKKEYTLAELFNQGYRPKIRQVGFGVR